MIDEIFNLTYLPLVTPYNLIDNIKLDNYSEILYKKRFDGITCELKCIVNMENITFYYEFDKNDFLQEAYYMEDEDKHYLFNRQSDCEVLKEKFYMYGKNNLCKIKDSL